MAQLATIPLTVPNHSLLDRLTLTQSAEPWKVQTGYPFFYLIQSICWKKITQKKWCWAMARLAPIPLSDWYIWWKKITQKNITSWNSLIYQKFGKNILSTCWSISLPIKSPMTFPNKNALEKIILPLQWHWVDHQWWGRPSPWYDKCRYPALSSVRHIKSKSWWTLKLEKLNHMFIYYEAWPTVNWRTVHVGTTDVIQSKYGSSWEI